MKSAISIFALTIGMMAVPAMAQNADKTIAGNPVLEADAAAVQARCDALGLADGGSIASDAVESNTLDDAGNASVAASSPTDGSNPPAEGLDNALTTIDLSTITLQNCQDGGWL